MLIIKDLYISLMSVYLENKIRENFDFEGTPIVLQFKNRGEE